MLNFNEKFHSNNNSFKNNNFSDKKIIKKPESYTRNEFPVEKRTTKINLLLPFLQLLYKLLLEFQRVN